MAGAENMFDLTSALFMIFWGIGWSAGVLVMLAILVVLLVAREIITVDSNGITLRIEVFGLGAEMLAPLNCISHLRYVDQYPQPGSNIHVSALVQLADNQG